MIHFKDIDLRFEDKTVFKGFNLDVRKGEKVLLRAPSGAGKSTLFKLLLGFQKPDGGKIRVNDLVLAPNTVARFRKAIAYVSQDVEFPDKNVWELLNGILSFRSNRHIRISKQEVTGLARGLGLPDALFETNAGQLSGGERQRLGLLTCMLLDRSIWLLDEVTSGLDAELKARVVDKVVSQDKTVLIISHDKVWTRTDGIRVKEW